MAPAVIVDILDGRHASSLMLKRLMKLFPVRWDENMAELR